MKPCEEPCPKCGSTEVWRQWRPAGRKVAHPISRDDCSPTAYYDRRTTFSIVTAEHIFHHCQTCRHEWCGDVMKEPKP